VRTLAFAAAVALVAPAWADEPKVAVQAEVVHALDARVTMLERKKPDPKKRR
jgi:hypothetical protein